MLLGHEGKNPETTTFDHRVITSLWLQFYRTPDTATLGMLSTRANLSSCLFPGGGGLPYESDGDARRLA